MERLNFTYTDVKGKVSDRMVAVLSNPSDKVFAVDLSELDEDAADAFSSALAAELDRHKDKVAELMAKHDLKFKLRQFFPEKMSDVIKNTVVV
jgi:hypothetical protein